MCLILFALHAHPDYPLILAANRDEFHARRTVPLAEWPDAPGVLAGRDAERGGTWLGVTRSGRWAAVTNFRDPTPRPPGIRSRGHLVGDFLRGNDGPAVYIRSLLPRLSEFDGFNLLVGDGAVAHWISNRAPSGVDPLSPLAPGLHGVSNHLLNTPWRKVVRGKESLADLLRGDLALDESALLDILLDDVAAADHQLPDTGVGLELERVLSSAFIRTPAYGTRSSTALLLAADGGVRIRERRFGPDGVRTGETRLAT